MVVPGLWLDFSPIVLRQLQVGMTEQQLRAQLDQTAEHLAEAERQGQRTVVIVDVSETVRASKEERKLETEWRTRHEAMLKRVSLGAAVLVPNQFVRGALTAILWLQPPPNGHIVTLRLSEAVDWAVARLTSHGVPVPDRVVHDRASVLREMRALLGRS